MKLVVNGATVKMYLDGLFGAQVPFPFKTGLTLGFGAYVDEAANVVRATFDNALILGGSAPTAGKFSGVTVQSGNVTITWAGPGVLQSIDALGTGTWQNVTPAPVGTSLTVPANQAAARYYRLRL